MNNDETIYEQIAKYVAGESSPEEAMQVEEWASQTNENNSYLTVCFQVFTPPIPQKKEAEEETVWKNLEREIGKNLVVARRRKLWVLSAAASVLLLLTTGILLNKKYKYSGSPVFYEAVSESKKVRLNDETEIVLAPYATVSMDKDYGKTNRSVALQGSASFFVTHNSTKSFVVTIGKLHIKDIGTRFALTSFPDSDKIEIVVQEGAVVAYDENMHINLNKGEAAVYFTTTRKFLLRAQPHIDSAVQTSKRATPKHLSSTKDSPLVDVPANKQISRQPDVLKEDSLTNFSSSDAEKVLGTPAKLTGSNTNKNNGLLKQSVQYRSVLDAASNLYSEIEYFANEEAANKIYERIRLQNSAAQDAKDLIAVGAKAFFQTDETNFYLLLFQKRNILFRVRISKLNSGVSTVALMQAARRKVLVIR